MGVRISIEDNAAAGDGFRFGSKKIWRDRAEPLGVDGAVDDAVVEAIDDAVEVEVAVEVGGEARAALMAPSIWP